MIQALDSEQLLALLGAARKHSERDWLMLLVGYLHGFRVSEIVALTRDNVRDGFIIVQRGKRSKQTTHPLLAHPEPLLNERQALLDLAAKTPRNQKLFGITRRQMDRLIKLHGKTAGVPFHKLHMHALKHSIATHLLPKIGPAALQTYCGWKSGHMVLEYTKMTEEQAVEAAQKVLLA